MSQRTNIPEFGKDVITLDHCSILHPKLEEALEMLGGDESFRDCALDFDEEKMLEFFRETWITDEFFRCFKSDFGKGILVGILAVKLLNENFEPDTDL